MNTPLPKPISDAQEKGIEYFMGEEHEWKLEVKTSTAQIEKVVGSPVCVFANNGYGDYLFLKKLPNENKFSKEVFEFSHEGPEIRPVKEDLETLLGLKERPPSSDAYPKAIYETGEPIELGDRVQSRSGPNSGKDGRTAKFATSPASHNANPKMNMAA